MKDIEFDTKSFSIFGVIYTVDFTYDGYTFSIPGEGSILLSALAEQLNLAEKNFALENVKDVTFSNDELLKIEKQEGDWLLTSLKAFSTEETLTILMADGSKFLIVVTDAQNALTINTSLYDYDDATRLAFPNEFCQDNVYAFVYAGGKTELKDLPTNTPWTVVDMNALKGSGSPYTINVDEFSTNPWYNAKDKQYSGLTDEQKNALRVRIIHTSNSQPPSLGSLQGMGSAEFEELWNGGFDGYAMSTKHPSGLISEGYYEVNFIKGNTLEHDVTLKFNPATDKGPIESGKYYVLLDATSADGNNHYYYVVEATADGTIDTVQLPITGNWSSNQPFSNNWQNIKASVITPKSGKTITTGGNKPANGDYDVSYMILPYQSTGGAS